MQHVAENIIILNYSDENLMNVLNGICNNLEYIKSKKQVKYLINYLNHINAKTMIIENDYIDKFYMEDYIGFYVGCFKEPKRNCSRLHFFSLYFKEGEFVNNILNNNVDFIENLKNSYLGFIVIKPLPKTIIGRTCLKTYNEVTSHAYRKFNATFNYTANLCGIPLNVKTLAFQEQDENVSACATISLWIALNGTSVIFNNYVPSPIEITKMAYENVVSKNRPIPNMGLTIEQMSNVIMKIGLEPVLINLLSDNEYDDVNVVKFIIRAYTSLGLPIILLVKIGKEGDNYHAVTLIGYSISKNINSEAKLYSDNIENVYVHDDQIGPFASFEIKTKEEIKIQKDSYYAYKLVSPPQKDISWEEDLYVLYALIPVNKKIVLTHEDVIKKIYKSICYDDFIVDIRLENLNEFKKKLISENIKGEYKKDILFNNMPHYLWVVDFYDKYVNKLKSSIFDATSFKQSESLFKEIFIKEIEF